MDILLSAVEVVRRDPEDLEGCETLIVANYQRNNWLKVGAALLVIHDTALFKKSGADSFSSYISTKADFGFGPRQALRLLAATKLAKIFPPTISLPTSERQVRALVGLEPRKAIKTWVKANLIAQETGVPLTHRLVESILSKDIPESYRTACADWCDYVGPESEFYRTPFHLVSAVKRLFGGAIDLDPCSDEVAQVGVQSVRFYSAEDDGLQPGNPWSGRVYVFPPAGMHGNNMLQGLFLDRATNEYKAGRVTEVVLLLRVSIGQKWFNKVFEYPHCFLAEKPLKPQPLPPLGWGVPEPNSMAAALMAASMALMNGAPPDATPAGGGSGRRRRISLEVEEEEDAVEKGGSGSGGGAGPGTSGGRKRTAVSPPSEAPKSSRPRRTRATAAVAAAAAAAAAAEDEEMDLEPMLRSTPVVAAAPTTKPRTRQTAAARKAAAAAATAAAAQAAAEAAQQEAQGAQPPPLEQQATVPLDGQQQQTTPSPQQQQQPQQMQQQMQANMLLHQQHQEQQQQQQQQQQLMAAAAAAVAADPLSAAAAAAALGLAPMSLEADGHVYDLMGGSHAAGGALAMGPGALDPAAAAQLAAAGYGQQTVGLYGPQGTLMAGVGPMGQPMGMALQVGMGMGMGVGIAMGPMGQHLALPPGMMPVMGHHPLGLIPGGPGTMVGLPPGMGLVMPGMGLPDGTMGQMGQQTGYPGAPLGFALGIMTAPGVDLSAHMQAAAAMQPPPQGQTIDQQHHQQHQHQFQQQHFMQNSEQQQQQQMLYAGQQLPPGMLDPSSLNGGETTLVGLGLTDPGSLAAAQLAALVSAAGGGEAANLAAACGSTQPPNSAVSGAFGNGQVGPGMGMSDMLVQGLQMQQSLEQPLAPAAPEHLTGVLQGSVEMAGLEMSAEAVAVGGASLESVLIADQVPSVAAVGMANSAELSAAVPMVPHDVGGLAQPGAEAAMVGAGGGGAIVTADGVAVADVKTETNGEVPSMGPSGLVLSKLSNGSTATPIGALDICADVAAADTIAAPTEALATPHAETPMAEHSTEPTPAAPANGDAGLGLGPSSTTPGGHGDGAVANGGGGRTGSSGGGRSRSSFAGVGAREARSGSSSSSGGSAGGSGGRAHEPNEVYNPRGSMLVYIGRNTRQFCQIFSELGYIPGFNAWAR